MADSVVQSVSGTSGTFVFSFSKTFGSTTSAGNLLIAVIVWEGGVGVGSVTDGAGNNYVKADDVGGFSCAVWYCENALANAGTVTVTSASSAFVVVGLTIIEVAGAPTTGSFDTSNSNSSTSTTPTTGTISGTTGQLTIAALNAVAGASITGAGGDWTDLYNVADMDGDIGGAVQYLIDSSNTTYSGDWTLNSSRSYHALITSFNTSGGTTVVASWWFYGSHGMGGSTGF